MKKSKPFRDIELELLKDPEKAREYLCISLEETRKDGNRTAFLRALRTVVDARGGIAELAKRTEKPTSSLYKTISEEGNPRLDTLDMILKDIGLELSVDFVEQQQ
ncbi:MAG: transcriptional regulator [Candidatus Omnitrophota bacterium]|jgi:probable addiction module antidote protein|nr:MAG: transcriptional regulator [Candidatus Omnitrophota bacterium]